MSNVNDPKEFEKLSQEEQETLLEWCNSLDKIENISSYRSSYGLKHDFEHSPQGFYISNGAFKGAMLKAGFKYRETKTGSPNWHFNVSKRSVRKMRENYGYIG